MNGLIHPACTIIVDPAPKVDSIFLRLLSQCATFVAVCAPVFSQYGHLYTDFQWVRCFRCIAPFIELERIELVGAGWQVSIVGGSLQTRESVHFHLLLIIPK